MVRAVPRPEAPFLPVSNPPLVAVPPLAPPVNDEAELCRRIGAGDDRAFELLVERYQHRIYAFCARLLNDRAEAEDVAQEVFLTLYRNAGDFRGESSFATWLYRIAKNQALNRIKYLDRRGRKQRARDELATADGPDAPESRPDALAEGGQTAALVQEAIGELEAEHRAVLVLRDLEDLSYEEISAATGLPIGTVKSRIHRGRSALAARLARFFR
ncbi:MAG: sigma-70 family RNA polymerase sigma factor [Deltaproteobacteria bacterium]|jgi:RNA polymerase sigma-70 factor (ECF subfamily)|nr:sigma-70 family RNA polymerase sigma factor [Deltaproteobacteria bacterium]